MDDKHIVAQARRGELSAFEELVTRYEKRVYAIALRSSGSPEDAADITQEVFLRAWRSMKDFRGDSGFATWRCRITMNQCGRSSGLRPVPAVRRDGGRPACCRSFCRT